MPPSRPRGRVEVVRKIAPTFKRGVKELMKRALIVMSLITTFAAAARAEDAPGSVRKPLEISMSRHEIDAHIGYQAGFGGQLGSASGLKVSGDYAYRFHRRAWFNLQVGNTFGFGSRDGLCVGSVDSQCYRGGWDFSVAAGARLKFATRVPLLIEVPLLLGVEVLYNRNCGDNGAAVVLRPGVRAKYFVTERIGLGAAINFAFGPSFHGGGAAVCTTNSYTGFYGAFDFMLGTEILL